MEVWLEVEEAPRYLVSSHGRVQNRTTGTILKPGLAGAGYPFVVLMGLNPGERFQRYLHRLVAKAFFDYQSDDLDVNHIDGDKQNNNIWNLELVTHKENMHHASRNGLMANVGAKKTAVRIVETGEVFPSQHACARAIGGRQSSIWLCLNGQRRSHQGYTFEFVDEA